MACYAFACVSYQSQKYKKSAEADKKSLYSLLATFWAFSLLIGIITIVMTLNSIATHWVAVTLVVVEVLVWVVILAIANLQRYE